jgi:hypothetical protein
MASLTTNKNFLSPVGFRFKLDSNTYPNLEYFCTQVTLPGLTLGSVDVPYRGANLSMTGDRMSFEDLNITFNITENMENYIETFDWMHNIINTGETFKADATLLILSSHNNVTKKIKFNDCFPTALSGAEFNTQASDIEYLQGTVTFNYTTFEFV